MEDVKIVNTVNLLIAAGNGAVHGIIHWKTRINSEIAIAIENAIKQSPKPLSDSLFYYIIHYFRIIS